MALDDFAPDVDFEKEMPEAAVEPAEVEAVEAVEAPKEAPKETTKEETKEYVPLATFLETKNELKELRRQAEEARKLAEEARKPIEQKVEPPSFDDNPAAHLLHNQQQVENQVRATQEEIKAFREQQSQQAQLQSLAQRIAADEAVFKPTKPDYDQAIEHLKKTADEILQDNGIADPNQRQTLIAQQIMQMSHQAIQLGKNPAEHAYRHAQRMGFQSKPRTDPVQQLSKGLDASKGLGNGSAESTLSLDAIASMSDSDIDKIVGSDEEWARLEKMMR